MAIRDFSGQYLNREVESGKRSLGSSSQLLAKARAKFVHDSHDQTENSKQQLSDLVRAILARYAHR
jgi:HPt (histidine-containing phosphotransfer) domain-containing protein